MINKKFGMISLGCDKNRVDGERLLGEIKKSIGLWATSSDVAYFY